LKQALAFGAEAILLDNMTPEQVKQSVERIKEKAPAGSTRTGADQRIAGSPPKHPAA
jgi:nicotinate-nucleotide pyrophosphorylase